MFFLALFLTVLPGDWFVGGGASYGSSLTSTEKNYSAVLGAQIFPFSYQKVGFFYDFQFRNHNFPVSKPFSVKESERAHSLGSVFRFSTGRIHPWLGGGVLFYSVNTEILLSNKLLIEEGETRAVPLAVAGTRFRIWKNLYEEIDANLAATARPSWHLAVRTVWRF